VILYALHEGVIRLFNPHSPYYKFVYFGSAILFVGAFLLLIARVERKELARLPYVGRFFPVAA
jgi:hypothetical protein